jgi:hypothetical protein
MGLFGSGKSALDKLAEEKAKIELQILKTPKPVLKPKSTRMVDETADEYGKRLMKHRRTGLY